MAISRQVAVRASQVAFLIISLACLEIMVRSNLISDLIVSSPSSVIRRVAQDLAGSELWLGLWTSASEFALAFSIALVLGVLLGLWFFEFRTIGVAAEPLLVAFYAAPTILLYPVFLTLFGLGSAAVVAMATVSGLVPIMLNVRVGLVQVEPILIKVGRNFGAKKWQMVRKILLPAATPMIFTGLRLGITYSIVSVIAVEFITYSGGLGKMVSWRYFVFDTDGVYAAILVVVVLAASVNGMLQMVERRIASRWI